MLWVEQDIRDQVVEFVNFASEKTKYTVKELLCFIDIRSSKFYSWVDRKGLPNTHNAHIPKENWLLHSEREAIIKYAKSHPGEGYRRLTYMMLDENIVAVSPTSTYHILNAAGLLNRWNKTKPSSKGQGFDQPEKPHVHWLTDIKYVNFKGAFLFLISVIDGYSRYIVHHELRQNMQEFDVEITVQRALEKHPGVKPRLITYNGAQYISKDFAEYLKFVSAVSIPKSIQTTFIKKRK